MSSGTWWYAAERSFFQNNLPPENACNSSSMCGIRKLLTTIDLFGSCNTAQSKILPFFTFTTTIRKTHSDAYMRSITSSCCTRWSSVATSSRTLKVIHCSFYDTGWTYARTLTQWTQWFPSLKAQTNKRPKSTARSGGRSVAMYVMLRNLRVGPHRHRRPRVHKELNFSLVPCMQPEFAKWIDDPQR